MDVHTADGTAGYGQPQLEFLWEGEQSAALPLCPIPTTLYSTHRPKTQLHKRRVLQILQQYFPPRSMHFFFHNKSCRFASGSECATFTCLFLQLPPPPSSMFGGSPCSYTNVVSQKPSQCCASQSCRELSSWTGAWCEKKSGNTKNGEGGFDGARDAHAGAHMNLGQPGRSRKV